MSADMEKYVLDLLKTYHERDRKIAILHFKMEHPNKVSKTEQIEAMTFGRGDGMGHTKGRVSNKTLYIALNYEEQVERMNAESVNGVADELFELEQRQNKLEFFISLLEKRQADVIKLLFLDKVPPKEVAELYGLTYRTIDRIKNAGIEAHAEMYAYSEQFHD